MAKARWTRASAINYLASNPDFTPAKPLDTYTDAYLKRTASAFQDAERAGRKAPTTAERRGHARASVEHLDANKEQHILDQYRVKKPIDRELDKKDIDNLYKRAARGKKESREVQVIITGISEGSPNHKAKYKKDQIHSYSYSFKLFELKDILTGVEDSDTFIFDFAYEISFLQWEEVLEISFAFPNEK